MRVVYGLVSGALRVHVPLQFHTITRPFLVTHERLFCKSTRPAGLENWSDLAVHHACWLVREACAAVRNAAGVRVQRRESPSWRRAYLATAISESGAHTKKHGPFTN